MYRAANATNLVRAVAHNSGGPHLLRAGIGSLAPESRSARQRIDIAAPDRGPETRNGNTK